MKRLLLLLLWPVLLAAVTPVALWEGAGLYKDKNGDTLSSAQDIISGNLFMTLAFKAGDLAGWNNIQHVKVRFWNTNASTNGSYHPDFAEYKYYPQDGHWTCLGPSSWSLDYNFSKGPAPATASNTALSMRLVFKTSSLATETGMLKSWKIRVSVSDGVQVTNIGKSCSLRQVSSLSPAAEGLFFARPNPFRVSKDGTMRFVYEPGFSGDCTVDLSIQTIYGEPVIQLEKSRTFLQGDPLSATWDGLNGAGQPVASGVYTGRLTVSYTEPKRTETLLFNFAVLR